MNMEQLILRIEAEVSDPYEGVACFRYLRNSYPEFRLELANGLRKVYSSEQFVQKYALEFFVKKYSVIILEEMDKVEKVQGTIVEKYPWLKDYDGNTSTRTT